MDTRKNSLFRSPPPVQDAQPLPPAPSRKALFRRQLGLHFTDMALPSLVTFLFYVPAVLWSEAAVDALPGDAGPGGAFAQGFAGSYLIVLCLLLAIVGPATAGLSLLTRNYARGDACFRWSTYFGGIKRNWKQGLIASALDGLALFGGYSALNYYGGLAQANPWYYVLFGITALICIIFLLMRLTVYTQLVTYALPFGKIVKNALFLSLLEFPRGLLALLLCASPMLFIALLCWLLPARMGYFILFGLMYYAFIGLSLERFMAASYANFVCQKHIDLRIPGVRVDVGLTTERSSPATEAAMDMALHDSREDAPQDTPAGPEDSGAWDDSSASGPAQASGRK